MHNPRELVDPAQVGTALAVLSAVALLLAVGLGALGRGRRSDGLIRAALILAPVALAWPLWVVYNRIEDHFGLDSVAALLINLVLFAAIGTCIGLLYRRVWPVSQDNQPQRHEGHEEEGQGTVSGEPA